MDWVGISTILAFVVAALAWLGFVPNGPHIVAKIKERWAERRREQRDLDANIQLLFKAVNELANDAIRQKNEVIAAIARGENPLTLAEFQAYRQAMDAKLEVYEAKQTALREEVARLGNVNTELVTRSVNLEQELSAIYAEHGQALKDLEREVHGNFAELGEALRMAENPSGALVERLARDRARTGTSATSSDAPRGR